MTKYPYITSTTGNYTLLKNLAKENRKRMTQAEAALWNMIKEKQLGYKFRRQHPIKDYIVDFLCLPLNLIIEIDGGYHNSKEQQRIDIEREHILENDGYTTIRFTNEDVLQNMEQVLNDIRLKMQEINQQGKEGTSPTPSQGGEYIPPT